MHYLKCMVDAHQTVTKKKQQQKKKVNPINTWYRGRKFLTAGKCCWMWVTLRYCMCMCVCVIFDHNCILPCFRWKNGDSENSVCECVFVCEPLKGKVRWVHVRVCVCAKLFLLVTWAHIAVHTVRQHETGCLSVFRVNNRWASLFFLELNDVGYKLFSCYVCTYIYI